MMSEAKKTFLGSVLNAAFGARVDAPSPDILAGLRSGFAELGRGSQALVLRLHRLDGASARDRTLLFAMSKTVALNTMAFDEANAFALMAIDEVLSDLSSPQEQILELLRSPHQSGWRHAVPKAIGSWLGRNPSTLMAIWDHLLDPDSDVGLGIVTIAEAFRGGAREAILTRMTSGSPVSVSAPQASAICGAVAAIAADLEAVEADAITNWLSSVPHVSHNALIFALTPMSGKSLAARSRLVELLNGLDVAYRTRLVGKMLRGLSSTEAKVLAPSVLPLLTEQGESDGAIVHIAAAGLIAHESDQALQTLLDYAAGAARRTSTAAVQALVGLPPARLSEIADELLKLLQSRYPYVRTSIIDLLARLREHGIPREVVLNALLQVRDFDDGATIQALLRLAANTTEFVAEAPTDVLLDVTSALIDGVERGRLVDGGTLRLGIRSMIPLVLDFPAPACHAIALFATRILRSVDLADVKDGERAMLVLLAATARNEPDYLAQLVDECFEWRARNVRALACAIRRCEGPNSPLLDRLVETANCPAEVTTAVLEWRGA